MYPMYPRIKWQSCRNKLETHDLSLKYQIKNWNNTLGANVGNHVTQTTKPKPAASVRSLLFIKKSQSYHGFPRHFHTAMRWTREVLA